MWGKKVLLVFTNADHCAICHISSYYGHGVEFSFPLSA